MKKLIVFIIFTLFQNNSYASYSVHNTNYTPSSNYNVKFRLGISESKICNGDINLGAPYYNGAGPKLDDPIIINGRSYTVGYPQAGYKAISNYGFTKGFQSEIAVEKFLNKNFAIEGSVSSRLVNIKNYYFYILTTPAEWQSSVEGSAPLNDFSVNQNSKKTANIISANAILQYHFAPDSTFDTYIGAGYSYEMIAKSPINTKIKNGGGFIAQLGFDIKITNQLKLNFDIKHSHKIKHKIINNELNKTSHISHEKVAQSCYKLEEGICTQNVGTFKDFTEVNVSGAAKAKFSTTSFTIGISIPL